MVYYDRLREHVICIDNRVLMKKYYFGLQEKLVIDGKSVTKVSWGNGYETAEKAVIANAQRVSQSPLGSHFLLGYFDESIMK